MSSGPDPSLEPPELDEDDEKDEVSCKSFRLFLSMAKDDDDVDEGGRTSVTVFKSAGSQSSSPSQGILSAEGIARPAFSRTDPLPACVCTGNICLSLNINAAAFDLKYMSDLFVSENFSI